MSPTSHSQNIMVLVYGILATVCVHTTVAMVAKPLAVEINLAAQMDTSTLYENAWHLLTFNVGEKLVSLKIKSHNQ